MIQNDVLNSLSRAELQKTEKRVRNTDSDKDIKKVAKDFEALLIGEIFKVMRKSIHKSKLTDGGFGEKIFESMLDGEISKSLAQRDMLGISRMLERELLGKVNNLKTSGRNLILPAIGKITSEFGMREHPVTHKLTHHDGIDIALKEGTPVSASLGGKVVFSGKQKGYGNVIIVKNGEYEMVYAHCSKLLFNKGENVKKGEKIALSGNTGVSTGPHLHFEVRYKGKPVNPFSLLK